jgi:hypothetical protein
MKTTEPIAQPVTVSNCKLTRKFMKKILLSAAILIAACISAQAQFSLGIKGGVNFSKINTDNLNSSTRTGYQAGIFARFGSGLYLQPELYLSGPAESSIQKIIQ